MCSKEYLDHSNWSSHSEFPSWRRWNQPDGALNQYSSSAFSKRRSWDPISHTFNGDTERPHNQYTKPYNRRSDSPYVSNNESAHDNNKITSNPNSIRQKAITTSNILRYHENLHKLETQTPITLKQTNQPTSTLCEQSIKLKKALLVQLPTLKAKDTGNIVKSNPQNTEPVCQLNSKATLNDKLVEPQKITQIVRSDSLRTSKYTLVNTTGSTRVLLDPQHPMQYVLLKPVEPGHTSHLKSRQTFPFIDSQFRAVNHVMQTDFQESMQCAGKFPPPSSQHLKTNVPVAEDTDGMIKQRPVHFFQRWPQESRDNVNLDTLNGIYQVHSEQKGTLHLNTTVMQRMPQVPRNISDCRVAASIPDSMVKDSGLSIQQSKKQDGGLKSNSNSDVYHLESLNVKRYKYIEDESNFDHDEDPVVKTEEFMDEVDQLDIENAKKSLEYTTTTNNNNDCTSRLSCSSIDKDMIRIKSKCKETKKNNSESDEGILLGTDILEKSLSDIVLVRSVGMSRIKNGKLNKMSNLTKEVKGKEKVAAFADEGCRDKVDIFNNKIEEQDCLGKVDITLHTSTRKSTSESSRPIEVFQRCKELFKLQEVVKNLSNTKDQTNVCKERKVVNNLSSTKDQIQTGTSKEDVRTLNAPVRPALESNRSAGSILKKLEEPDKRQKQQIDPIKPAIKNDSEISSDMYVCVKGNAINFNLAHSNFLSKIDAARKLKQELTPSRNVLGAIELHDGSNVCLKDHKKSPAKIRKRKIMCKSLKPKDTGSSDVVDRCPRGHFLKPLLATFNLQTGQIMVPCRKCRSVIYMQSKVNSLL